MVQEEKLSRRERDRLRHKEEIFDAALKLFSEKGFHNVSMQEIASAAEFATGTLYNFFSSKEALYEELCESRGERIIGDISAALDCPGGEVQRLRTLVRMQPALLAGHIDFVKVYVSELGTRGAKHAQKKSDRFHDILDEKVAEVVQAGIDRGLFRKVDAVTAAKAFHSLMETLAFDMADSFDEAVAKEAFQKVEQLLIDGLLLPEDSRHDQ